MVSRARGAPVENPIKLAGSFGGAQVKERTEGVGGTGNEGLYLSLQLAHWRSAAWPPLLGPMPVYAHGELRADIAAFMTTPLAPPDGTFVWFVWGYHRYYRLPTLGVAQHKLGLVVARHLCWHY